MTAITLMQARKDVATQLTIGNVPIVLGPVGVGKTDLIRLVARDLNLPMVIDKRASQLDPTDTQAPMPNATTGLIDTYIPAWFPCDASRFPATGLLLFDEFTDAQLGVQAALNQVLLEREIAGRKMLPGWFIAATGNRSSDRAAAQKVSRASGNRMAIMETGVDVQSWLQGAISGLFKDKLGNPICPEFIAFIQHAENAGNGVEMLHKYPTQAGSDAVAFNSPRSIVACNPLLAQNLSNADLTRNIAHNTGEDWSRTFMNFLATYRLLPNLNAILADPRNAIVPREPSVNYALGVALVSKLTMANLPAINEYVKRLDPLYRAAFWSNAASKDAAFKETPEHVAHLIAQSNAN